jgi:hypothetical protein
MTLHMATYYTLRISRFLSYVPVRDGHGTYAYQELSTSRCAPCCQLVSDPFYFCCA